MTAKIAIVGYSIFHEVIIRAFQAAGLKVACAATQVPDPEPDDALEALLTERGLCFSLVEAAREIGVAYHLFDSLNSPEAISAIRKCGATAVLSCSAPILLPAFLHAFEGQVFNFHGSLRYRGRAAWSWLILSGHQDDSLVLHRIDNGIDTGAHLAEGRFAWSRDAYPIDVAAAQLPVFRELAGQLAELILAGRLPEGKTSPSRPYLPTLFTPKDGWIDWHWGADEAERAIRAFGWPYPGASTIVDTATRNTMPVRLARAEVLSAENPAAHPLMVGCVIARKPNAWADVQCGRGVLRILSLRNGHGEEPAADTLKLGCRLRCRQELGRPQ